MLVHHYAYYELAQNVFLDHLGTVYLNFKLDGLLGHDSNADLTALHVDGGGVSDIVFASSRISRGAFWARMGTTSRRPLPYTAAIRRRYPSQRST